MEDDKTLHDDVPENDEELDDDEAAAELAEKITALKGEESKPADDEPPAKEAPAKQEPPKDGDEPPEDGKPADQQEPSKTFTEADIEARVQALLQERIDAATREAAQKAADAVVSKERAREDSYRRKLMDMELRTGKKYEQIVAEMTGRQVQELMDQGYDEATARRLIEAEAKTRTLEAMEQDRQREHAIFKAKNDFTRELGTFMADPNADASVKKLTVKYQKAIEEFAYGGIENGNAISMEVARDYVLGKHLAELLKEQQAEIERIKTATEQRTLKNVQERGKAKVESGSTAVPSAPTVSRDERAFLKKLGMDDNDIADIAKKRAARKK